MCTGRWCLLLGLPNDHLSEKEMFIRFTMPVFRRLFSTNVYTYFPFGMRYIERVPNQVNKRVRMHEFVYIICKVSRKNISLFKDCLPHLFHGFRNRHFIKISLDNMLYFHN